MRDHEGELLAVLLGAPQVKRSEDALGWHVTFYLGQDVQLKQGIPDPSGLERRAGHRFDRRSARLGTSTFAAVRSRSSASVRGIEPSSLKFLGEGMGDSYVNFKARWDSPNEVRVYAKYLGPLKTFKINWESEPHQTDDKILALLLFGDSEDPSTKQGSESDKNKDLLVGGVGNVMSMGVNQALAKVTPGVTTRVAADEQSPTPEVAIQLGPEGQRRGQLPDPAPHPWRAARPRPPDPDWNFRRNSSGIGTTVGDRGSSVLESNLAVPLLASAFVRDFHSNGGSMTQTLRKVTRSTTLVGPRSFGP